MPIFKIYNQGIGSDITAGMLNRVHFVIRATPSVCFIEGGINDLEKKLSIEGVVHNVSMLCIELKSHSIQPVVTLIFHVASSYPNSKQLNIRIDKTNVLLKRFCLSSNTRYIEIQFSSSDYQPDNIHLKPSGYIKWANRINHLVL